MFRSVFQQFQASVPHIFLVQLFACLLLCRGGTQALRDIPAAPHQSGLHFAAGDDGCLVWDVVEGACTAALEGPAVRWAACLDDGRHLLCASGDRTTTLWDLSTSTSSVAVPGSRGSRVKSWAASQVRAPSPSSSQPPPLASPSTRP